MIIFLYRKSISFSWYAKYRSTANNAKVASKNIIFRKFGLNLLKILFFENIASFSCKGFYAFLPDIQIIILLSIKNILAKLSKKIRTFGLKVLKIQKLQISY